MRVPRPIKDVTDGGNVFEVAGDMIVYAASFPAV